MCPPIPPRFKGVASRPARCDRAAPCGQAGLGTRLFSIASSDGLEGPRLRQAVGSTAGSEAVSGSETCSVSPSGLAFGSSVS